MQVLQRQLREQLKDKDKLSSQEKLEIMIKDFTVPLDHLKVHPNIGANYISIKLEIIFFLLQKNI